MSSGQSKTPRQLARGSLRCSSSRRSGCSPRCSCWFFLGIPVAFCMIGLSFAFGLWFFGDSLGAQMLSRLHEVGANYVLTAIPLFIFMGSALERSGIAERLFHAIQQWIGRLRGGLALTSVSMCGVFAATTGIVGAVETVVGMMAIPPMMKHRYKHDLISGTICAGGSLGTIIPPTVVVVVYGSVVEESIGDLFAGGPHPGPGDGRPVPGLYRAALSVAATGRPADGPRRDPGPARRQADHYRDCTGPRPGADRCGPGLDSCRHRLADRSRRCRRIRRDRPDFRLSPLLLEGRLRGVRQGDPGQRNGDCSPSWAERCSPRSS